MKQNEQNSQYLKHALSLAEHTRGQCAPNPAVGAVLVKDTKILAEGVHLGVGHDHAEIAVLQQVSHAETEGATLYVTLEPCCHQGKTPPCTEAIKKFPLAQVIYAYQDPNPLVAGQGHKILEQAGIVVEQHMVTEIDYFYQSYQYWQQQKRPFITAKLALSLDGKIAGYQGQPQQITGPELQQLTHQQRLHSDAILTTVRTIIHDDPQLNVRINKQTQSKPLYILDSQLQLPENASVRQTAKAITLFYDAELSAEQVSAQECTGVSCVPITREATGLCLTSVMDYIGKQGVHDLWVEAGGQLLSSLLNADLVQRCLLYVAPKIIGDNGLTAFSQADILAKAHTKHWQVVGNDVLCQLNFYTD